MGFLNIMQGFFGLIVIAALLAAIVYSFIGLIQKLREAKFAPNANANIANTINSINSNVVNSNVSNSNVVNSNVPVPDGTGFLGCYNAPSPFNDQGDTAISQFVEVDCDGPCPDVCKEEALKLYPDGALFAVNASGQCRVGPTGQAYDNAGTAECGSDGSWRMYEVIV